MRSSGSAPVPPPLPEPPLCFEVAPAKEQCSCSVEHPRKDLSTDACVNTVPVLEALPCESWEDIMRRIIREELADALHPRQGTCPPVALHPSQGTCPPVSSGEPAADGTRDKGGPLPSESCEGLPSEQVLSRHPTRTCTFASQESAATVHTTIQGTMQALKRTSLVPYAQNQLNFGPREGYNLLHPMLHRLIQFAHWWQDLKEPAREGVLYEFVEGARFQVVLAIVIGVNSIIMGISTDYEVQGKSPASLKFLDVVFTLVYSIELSLKIAVHRQYFFCNDNMRWNLFDGFLVGLSAYELCMDLFLGGGQAFNASFMRSLRILRAGKVLRIFRLVRAISQLRLILNVLMGSMAALFWSLVMMLIMYYICGLVFVQGTASYFAQGDDDSDNIEKDHIREGLEQHFGSVIRAMRTMFMATTGGEDWNDYYSVINATGSGYGLLFVSYIAFNTVAFLNVLTALFVEHAIETAKPGREDTVLFQRQARMMEATELTRLLLEDADKDRNGCISVEEFNAQMEDDNSPLRVYLEADGIDGGDASLFFNLLKSCTETDGCGQYEVDIRAFVMGLMKIRGGATSLDVQGLVWQTQVIYRTMMSQFQSLEDKINRSGAC